MFNGAPALYICTCGDGPSQVAARQAIGALCCTADQRLTTATATENINNHALHAYARAQEASVWC